MLSGMAAAVDVLVRAAPAAHLALVGDTLVDAGTGTSYGLARVEEFLAGRPVALIALTHAHHDHASGAAALRDRLGAAVALHGDDLDTITRDATLLDQPLAPFAVDRVLADGDEPPGGLRVVATPGQTPGHVAYWHATSGTALTGDLVQDDDVAWMPFEDGVLDRAIEAVRRIAELRPRLVVPGHGQPVTDVAGRVAATIERYEDWGRRPERRVGHHARRIVAAWLTLREPPTRPEALDGLAAIPILRHAAAHVGREPQELAAGTLDELLGSGALALAGDRLVPRFPVERPSDTATEVGIEPSP
jgi:glyoxylase-like metal-dependent hydrolase (beta-lactamase superfamily II)